MMPSQYVVHEIPYIQGDGSPFRDAISSSSGLISDGGAMLLQRGFQVLRATGQNVSTTGGTTLEFNGRLLVSPDGTHAVTMNTQRDVSLWRVQPAILMAFGNGDLQCWDLLRGSILWQTFDNRCTSLATDPAGELVAGWDETLPGAIIFDVGSGRRLSSIRWPGAVVPGSPALVVFSKDGQHLRIARQRTCLEWAIRNVYASAKAPEMASPGMLTAEFQKIYDHVGYRVIPEGPEAGQAVPEFYYQQTMQPRKE